MQLMSKCAPNFFWLSDADWVGVRRRVYRIPGFFLLGNFMPFRTQKSDFRDFRKSFFLNNFWTVWDNWTRIRAPCTAPQTAWNGKIWWRSETGNRKYSGLNFRAKICIQISRQISFFGNRTNFFPSSMHSRGPRVGQYYRENRTVNGENVVKKRFFTKMLIVRKSDFGNFFGRVRCMQATLLRKACERCPNRLRTVRENKIQTSKNVNFTVSST
jgi:hypothetical protein